MSTSINNRISRFYEAASGKPELLDAAITGPGRTSRYRAGSAGFSRSGPGHPTEAAPST
jgi:hypothetical protein